MSLKKLLTASAAYNYWANQRILKWLANHPAELLHTKLESSYPTIHLTMKHITGAEIFWLNIIQGKPVEFKQVVEILEQTALADYGAVAEQFSKFVESLSDEELSNDCTLNTSWAKAVRPTYEFIQHCMNHSSYHRGQIITLGRTLGMQNPPNTDFNTYVIPITTL